MTAAKKLHDAKIRVLLYIGLIYIFTGLTTSRLKAQDLTIPVLGQNRNGLNWQAINNGKVEIIFPRGMETKAQRIARLTSSLHDNLITLGERRHKISIILRNQTNVSNGFVAFAPFRSEFFMTPPQIGLSGTVSWLDLLAIHEYRHVQQLNNADQGVTKALGLLLGQTGKFISLATALPFWFLEGDATLNETLLTNGGRGRFSNFINQYRALVLEGKQSFSYERASAYYSFKYFLPNHYHLGYYMTAHIRKTYGEDVWAKVVSDANRYKGVFYPFSQALKRHTGKNTHQLYNETFQALKDYWQTHQETLTLTTSTQINKTKSRNFINYNLPQYISQDSWLVQKSSFEEVPAFYLIDRNGKEKRLFQASRAGQLNNVIHYRKNWMVWTELRPHPRWYLTDYYVLKAYNFKTGEKRTLTHRSRYFAPNLSPDAQQIVAVAMDEFNNSTLEILNLEGKILAKLPNPEKFFYTFPTWNLNDNQLIVVVQKGNQNALAKININTGEHQILINYTSEQITFPRVSGQYIFFSTTDGGINNIHAFDTQTTKRYQVTSTLFGAYEPQISPDGQELVFTEYTSSGRNLKTMPLDSRQWKIFEIQSNFSSDWLGHLPQGDVKIEENDLEVKTYKPGRHLLNLHSWSLIPTPLISSNSNNSLYTGIFIDDKLSNFSSEVGLGFNLNENTSGLSASLKYGGWTPILELGFQIIGRSASRPVVNLERRIDIIRNRWNEQDLFFKVSLPINISTGNTTREIGLVASYHNTKLKYKKPARIYSTPIGVDETIGFLELGFSFENTKPTALRQIKPRFGQEVTLTYQQTIAGNDNTGKRLRATGTFYLPGLMRTHNFFVDLGYVEQEYQDSYQFRRTFFQTRGYTSLPLHDGIYTLRLNYTLTFDIS